MMHLTGARVCHRRTPEIAAKAYTTAYKAARRGASKVHA